MIQFSDGGLEDEIESRLKKRFDRRCAAFFDLEKNEIVIKIK